MKNIKLFAVTPILYVNNVDFATALWLGITATVDNRSLFFSRCVCAYFQIVTDVYTGIRYERMIIDFTYPAVINIWFCYSLSQFFQSASRVKYSG